MKTAHIVIHHVFGTSWDISATISYRGRTLHVAAPAVMPRSHMLQNAKHIAKNMGFTHVRVLQQYRNGAEESHGEAL
jgi:hypothetical protein